MDFALPPEIEDYRSRIRDFVETHIIPLEADRDNYDEHENIRPDVLEGVLRTRRHPVVIELDVAGVEGLQAPRSILTWRFL